MNDIRFYSSTYEPFSVNTGIGKSGADDAIIAVLRQVRETGKPVSVSDPDNRMEIRYFVADTEDSTTPIHSLLDIYTEW